MPDDSGPRGAVGWFVGFLILLVISGVIDPRLAVAAEPVPEAVRVLFFVLNVGGDVETFLLVGRRSGGSSAVPPLDVPQEASVSSSR
jgi:hypothetical protein